MKREGHTFEGGKCKACNLHIHDYDMLKEIDAKRKLPCPYFSEKLPPPTDTRVNR